MALVLAVAGGLQGKAAMAWPPSQYNGVYLTVSEAVPSVLYPDRENLEVTVHTIGSRGNAPEWVYRGEPAVSFQVVLKDDKGKVIEPKADLKAGLGDSSHVPHMREVVPMRMGDSWTQAIDLGPVYGRLAPGAYRASVRWEFFGHVPAPEERSEHPLMAETSFLVPEAAGAEVAVRFTQAAKFPWETFPNVEAAAPRNLTESMPFAKFPLVPITSIHVVWYDGGKLRSQEDAARMLRTMFSSARSSVYPDHVWSWGDAEPALEAEVTDADGAVHRLTYWADFGGYWAYQEGGHWYWAGWAR